MNALTGFMYNIPGADAKKPFAAIRIHIIDHYSNTTNNSGLSRVQFFTIDTSKFEEGADFALSNYFGLPPASSVPTGTTSYIKAKPTVQVPINYMNEYELWLSNGHTGTYEQFLMTRTIEPQIAKAFHGNMSTLVKRFEFHGEPITKVTGYRILVTNPRARFQIRT